MIFHPELVRTEFIEQTEGGSHEKNKVAFCFYPTNSNSFNEPVLFVIQKKTTSRNKSEKFISKEINR